MLGLYAFAMFCLVLSLSVPARGIAFAFVLAFACSGATQAATRALVRLRRTTVPRRRS
jgi:hypothetical protein